MLPASVFREYDIRGIAGRDLSPEFAELLGRAYAHYLKSKVPDKSRYSVSVGRDCRLSSDSYASALMEGIVSEGIHVINIGVCPTPVTYFSVFQGDLDGGIMVTGSHNPADYNGFKICLGKDTLHGHQIQELRHLMEELVRKPREQTISGTVSFWEIIPEYIDYLASRARELKPKRIVLDAGNGTASEVAPELFQRLGAEVIPLYCEMDGRFPNHHPDPTVVENLKDLITTVKEKNADFGIAFDGDSDRIGLVDETGRVLFGDEILVVLARDVLRENKGATIISEVKSSSKLYNDIAAHGGNPIMWKTGHSLIKAKMKETKALLAGEMSGHIFFADRYFGYDDAIYAALRLYEIASFHNEPFSSLVSGLPETVCTPEIRIECEEKNKFDLVAETKNLLKDYKINDIDGVRVDFGDSWGLLRASNTQPVLVLRFEAPSEDRLSEIRKIVESALAATALKMGENLSL